MVIYQKIKATTFMENTVSVKGSTNIYFQTRRDNSCQVILWGWLIFDTYDDWCRFYYFIWEMLVQDCTFTELLQFVCLDFSLLWHYIGEMWLFISSWLWVWVNLYLFLWLAVCKIVISENNPPSADNDIHWFIFIYFFITPETAMELWFTGLGFFFTC